MRNRIRLALAAWLVAVTGCACGSTAAHLHGHAAAAGLLAAVAEALVVAPVFAPVVALVLVVEGYPPAALAAADALDRLADLIEGKDWRA